jgi:hypothetical protein
MDQISHLLGLDVPILQQLIDPRIDGHDGIKDTGLRIGIELD